MRRPIFLESPRFPLHVRFERPGGPGHNVDAPRVESGQEYRNEAWGGEYISEFQVGVGDLLLSEISDLNQLFNAAQGMALGFRMRDWGDFKSIPITEAGPDHDTVDVISALDQVISVDLATADIFQLRKTDRWGIAANAKTITKPSGVPDTATGTVLLAIQGITIPTSRYDLLYVPTRMAREGHETVGRVTLAANIQKTVSGITQASSAVVTTSTAHGLSVNDSVHFGTDVGGMTQIRGKRGLITAVGDSTHFTVAIDSTAFTAFTSGGTINTQRQNFAFNVSISAIKKQAFATITAGSAHGLVPGDIGIFSGVGGMTELNGVTATVLDTPTDTTFHIDVSTIDFTTYTSGGTFAVSERVTAGYEYDLPCRFNTNNLPRSFTAWNVAKVDLLVIEIRVATTE